MKKELLLALVCMAVLGCSKSAKDASANSQDDSRVENVRVTTLQPREIERVITISSNLQGYETVNIAPSVTGKIEHIYVEVGKRIAKGDTLVRMDQMQYKTAKLTMSNLEIEKNRMDALLKSGSVSQQNYDQVKLNYDQTKENLTFLQSNTYVKAPFAGIISAKNYEDGELYGGQAIVVLTQINKLKTLIAVPETYYPLIKAGMQLTVKSEIYPDKSFPATIEIVYPTIDASSHTFQCKVVVPNASDLLRPGMYVTTTLGLGKEKTIVAPYQAVEKLVGANDRYVFINNNGRAQRVNVTLGQRFDEDIEIIAPEIQPGVEMVTTGQHRLVDGVRLEIQQ